MTDFEITKKNIANIAVVIPSSDGVVRLYESSILTVYGYGVNHPEDSDYAEEKRNLVKRFVNSVGSDNVFVESISIRNKELRLETYTYTDETFEESLRKFDINQIIESNFEGIEYIAVSERPTYKGELDISQYSATLDDQKAAIEAAISKMGYELVEDFMETEYDEPEDCIVFHNDTCCNDYNLFHGSDTTFKWSDAYTHHINGRVENYNDDAISSFWEVDFECMKEYFNETDPHDKVVAYHRKGKDWYISRKCEQVYICLSYKDKDEIEEQEYWIWITDPNIDEIQEKMISFILETHRAVEIDGRINNLLIVGDAYFSEYDKDDRFNITILKREYESLWIAKNQIQEMLPDSPGTVKGVVAAAYEKFLRENMDERGRIFGKYKHLNQLKKIAQDNGGDIVKSMPYPGAVMELYAISYQGEEYHFELRELLNTTPKKLYRKAIEAINKRKKTKRDNAYLMKMASSVFVGIEDSIHSGNCMAGTKEFCIKYGIDTNKIGGIRGDVLLSYDYNNFTKRAVLQAISRLKKQNQKGEADV